MTTKQKTILKNVGIILGVLLLIGAVIAFAIRKGRDARLVDDTDTTGSSRANYSPAPTTTGSGYTKEEVKAMQVWLIQKAATNNNNVIISAIRTTGGIDGIIGEGFYTALREAIAQGYVTSLGDLYKKATK